MANVGRLIVELIASTATFQSDLGKAAAAAEREAKRINRAIEDTKTQVASLGKQLLGAFGVGIGVRETINFLDDLKSKAAEDERSIASLNAVLKTTGQSAGLTRQDLNDLAQGVRGGSIFKESDIRAAEVSLLRFRSVQGDTFKQTLQLVPDVATALGTDLPSAAVILGKALEGTGGQMRQLKSAGLSLTDSEIDLADRLQEAGDIAGAQKVRLDALTKSVGGAAAADTTGLYGATKRTSRAWEELQEIVGHKLFDDDPSIEPRIGLLERLGRAVKTFNAPGATLFGNIRNLFGAFGGSEPVVDKNSIFAQYAAEEDAAQKNAEKKKAADAQAAKDEEQQREKARIADYEALRKRSDQAGSFYAAQIEAQKAFLNTQLAQLDFAYSHGNVTVENFYAGQEKAADSAFDAEQESILKQVGLLEKLRDHTHTAQAQKEADQAKIDALLQRSEVIARTADENQVKRDLAKENALRALADRYGEIDARVLEVQGHLAEATTTRFDIANRDLIQSLKTRALTGPTSADRDQAAAAVQQLSFLRDQAEAQARLNELERDYTNILDRAVIAQTHIDIAQKTGQLTELDALNARAAIAQKYVVLLQQVADAAEKEAQSLSGPAQEAALIKVEQLRLKIEELAADTDAVAAKFRDVFVSNFTTAFVDVATGAKSLKDAVRDLSKGILHDLDQIAAKDVAERLFGKSGALGGVSDFFAGIFGKGGSSLPGIAGPINVKDIFGGGAGGLGLDTAAVSLNTAGLSLDASAAALSAAAAALGATAGTQAGSNLLDFIKAVPTDVGGFFADGGNPPTGKLSVVGERGPELIMPRQPVSVVPLARSSGRGGHQISVTVNVPPGTDSRSATMIGRETALALQRAMQRS